MSALENSIESELGDAKIDFDADLFEQGLNSLAVMKLIVRAKEKFGVDIDLEDFLGKPSMRYLGQLVRDGLESSAPSTTEENGLHENPMNGRPPFYLDNTLSKIAADYALDWDGDLFEQGLTSLNLVEVLIEVKKHLNVDVELDRLLENPTLRHLGNLIFEDGSMEVCAGEGSADLFEMDTNDVAAGELGILASLEEKKAHIDSRFAIREQGTTIGEVNNTQANKLKFLANYELRRSQREFDSTPVSRVELLGWLAHLDAHYLDEDYRYSYPSAGGTYCIQTYIEVKTNGVDGVDSGLYYYNPIQHRLDKLSSMVLPRDLHFFYNRKHYDASQFCLYFVSERRAIEPLYGSKSDFFASIEVGAMLQLLADRQSENMIGSTALAGVNEHSFSKYFQLGETQSLLLAMGCGRRKSGAELATPQEEGSRALQLDQDIAIVGINGRFPGANSIEALWHNLKNGLVSFSEVPDGRWEGLGQASHWGGFVDSIQDFDAEFFDLAKIDVDRMHPQEKIFLRSVYELLDSAGYSGSRRKKLGRNVGVFAGVMWGDAGVDAQRKPTPNQSPFSSIVNRVSWFFDWAGPSMVIDTSCSSSLTSVISACRAIAMGDCDVAVAGGVNVFAHPFHFENLKDFNMVGEGREANAFGAAASGLIPGEGVGTVLLKPLWKAEADGDNIWGVVKGGAISHGGKTSSYGMPSAREQQALMEASLKKARCEPKNVVYVEAAAAGSLLGDASEIQAIQGVFSSRTDPLYVGTVKSNIGHLESASGVSQLVKLLLQMHHNELVPVTKLDDLNPLIQLDGSPIEIVQQTQKWPDSSSGGRLAMVNSFGGTGSYANLVVERYLLNAKAARGPKLLKVFALSARSTEELRSYAFHWLNFISEKSPGCTLSFFDSLLATSQLGRDTYSERLAIPADSIEHLRSCLAAYVNGVDCDHSYRGSVDSVDKIVLGEVDVANTHEISKAWIAGRFACFSSLYAEPVTVQKIVAPGYPLSHQVSQTSTKMKDIGVRKAAIADVEVATSKLVAGEEILQAFESHVVTICAQLLGLPPTQLDRTVSLFDLGLNSALAVGLVKRLEAATGERLQVSVLFTHTSIRALSRYLTENYSDALSSYVGKDQSEATSQQHQDPLVANGVDVVATLESIPERFDLSEGQRGLWILQKNYPSMSAYNCPAAFLLDRSIDPLVLSQAVIGLIDQFPILRTRIFEEEGVAFQRVDLEWIPDVEEIDISDLEERAIGSFLAEEARRPFIFDEEPLFRTQIFKRSKDRYYLLFTIHHAIVDGRSTGPIFSTLFSHYRSLLDDGHCVQLKYDVSWHQFVSSEKKLLASNRGKECIAFWKDALSDAPPSSTIFPDSSRLEVDRFCGATHSSRLPEHLAKRVEGLTKLLGVYPSTLFLGLFNLLVHRCTGQDDIVVGMPTDARPPTEVHSDRIGYFVYTLPIRSTVTPRVDFKSYIAKLQNSIFSCLENALPFPAIVRQLAGVSGRDATPLFQHAFVYQQADSNLDAVLRQSSHLVGASHIREVAQEGEYVFALEMVEDSEGYVLNIKYNPELYRRSTVLRFIEHYILLLKSVADSPEAPMSDYLLLSEAEENLVLSEWNTTEIDRAEARCLHEAIALQSVRVPDAPAVVFGNKALSYRELDVKANQLAYCLQQLGVGKGTLVGVCMQRSMEMVVALLGILKAGAAYVPIDPSYPKQRIQFVLKDTAAPVVVTTKDIHSALSGYHGKLVFLDAQREELNSNFAEPTIVGVAPTDLCYVMYTSGSTGNPKGCMLTHEALFNRLTWMQEKYRLDEGDRVLQKTPFSFDVSVWEFFWPLMTGACLYVLPPDVHKIPDKIVGFIQQHKITTCHFVPSMLSAFLGAKNVDRCGSLRQIFTSGEALSYSLCESAREKLVAKVHNLYGPTEAAIDVSYWESEERADRKVPIGRPISNTQLYIVDQAMRPVPIGTPGELLIGGMGLAKGYLNRPELTREKFIDNPFSDHSDTRLYRTGDLARWLADGNIEYLGRIDSQVKIRGFRIELGEIEERLKSHVNVHDAVVIAEEDPQREKYLVAYVVLNSGDEAPFSVLKAHLRETLPEFMVPGAFVALSHLPRTPNGKMDRKSLASARLELAKDAASVAPTTKLECEVADVWRKLLALEHIGLTDDFFEIGGNSLNAISMVHHVQEATSRKNLSLVDFYRTPTIAGIVSLLGQDIVGVPDAALISPLLMSDQPTELTLICIPYAGATAATYVPLSAEIKGLSEAISVYALTPPGNDVSANYVETESLELLARQCADEIEARITGRIAIYGHCVGSYLALELTRQLELRSIDVEFLLVAAAFPLPRIIRYLPIGDRWQFKSDESLWSLLEDWGLPTKDADERTREFLLTNFRRDARLAYQYEKRRGQWKISTSVGNLVSKKDPLTSDFRKRHSGWRQCVDNLKLLVIEEGGHYFIGERPDLVARAIWYMAKNSVGSAIQDVRSQDNLGEKRELK